MKNSLDPFAYTLHRPRFFNQCTMIVCTTGALGLQEAIDRLLVIQFAAMILLADKAEGSLWQGKSKVFKVDSERNKFTLGATAMIASPLLLILTFVGFLASTGGFMALVLGLDESGRGLGFSRTSILGAVSLFVGFCLILAAAIIAGEQWLNNPIPTTGAIFW